MKRWPMKLAVAGILLDVGIGVCADREEAPGRAVEWTRIDAFEPASAESLEASTAIDAPSEPRAPSRNPVENTDEPASTNALEGVDPRTSRIEGVVVRASQRTVVQAVIRR